MEGEVLGGGVVGEGALNGDAHGFGAALGEGLGGEDVFDLAGADAEGEGAEAAMGGGVAIAADEGGAGEGEAEFGADDVDDALVGVVEVHEGDAEVAAVAVEGFELLGEEGVGDRGVACGGGDGVVGDGDGGVGAADGAVGGAEGFEGLGGADFLDEVAVDVEEVDAVFEGGDDVGVPDAVEEGWHGGAPGTGDMWVQERSVRRRRNRRKRWACGRCWSGRGA